MTFVDSNILIDIVVDGPEWYDWSAERLLAAGSTDQLAISPIVYGELAPQYETQLELETFVASLDLELVPFSREALHRAGRALDAYRQAGGKRTRMLPDFLLGAQAEDLGCTVLTRDPRPFRAYFPSVALITP